jgi:Tol biopolymer transport system component
VSSHPSTVLKRPPSVLLASSALIIILAFATPAVAHRTGDERIGFQSDRGTTTAPYTQVFTMHADGTDVRLLLPGFENSFDAAWSQDGSRFAFITIVSPVLADLYVARGDGTRARRVTTGFGDGGPEWSPSGDTLAFHTNRDGNHEIHLMKVDRPWSTWNLTRNLANDCGCDDPFYIYAPPSFSPDGRRLTFTSDLAAPGLNLDIYTINRDGTGLRRLTTDAGVDAESDWSPDGRRIAFNSNRDGDHELYVMDTDGRHPRQLTRNQATDRQPEWSPTGHRLAYASDVGGTDDIWVMNANGSRARNVTDDAHFDERPAWQPQHHVKSDDH